MRYHAGAWEREILRQQSGRAKISRLKYNKIYNEIATKKITLKITGEGHGCPKNFAVHAHATLPTSSQRPKKLYR